VCCLLHGGSIAPEIHRWIRPASLEQRTVSFFMVVAPLTRVADVAMSLRGGIAGDAVSSLTDGTRLWDGVCKYAASSQESSW
jgi:hypothetical protein